MKKVKIEVGIIRSKIIGKYPFDKLFKELSVYDKKAQFAASCGTPKDGEEGGWDGYVRFLTKNHTFPTGLLLRVITFLKSAKYKILIVRKYDRINLDNIEIEPPPDKTLRKYQIGAIEDILHSRRGICKIATAGGKTLIAASAIASINQPSVFLVHKKDILYQTYKALTNTFAKKDVGLVGDGIKRLSTHDVMSIPTLYSDFEQYRKHLSNKVVMFGDEVHHASSNSWSWVMKRIPAQIRIGLSATPAEDKLNLLKLEAVTGPIITDISTHSLIRSGYLSEPKIIMFSIHEPFLSDKLSHQRAYTDGIEQNNHRNSTIGEIVEVLTDTGNVPMLIIVRTIKHMANMEEQLKSLNIRFHSLHGVNTRAEREKAVKELETGDIDVILSTFIFEEGVDIPSLKSMILASGGKSERGTIQKIGRPLRKTEEVDKVIIVDLFDKTQKYLTRHSNKRIRTYRAERHDVTIVDNIRDFRLKVPLNKQPSFQHPVTNLRTGEETS